VRCGRIAAAALVLVGLAGCGGGDDKSTGALHTERQRHASAIQLSGREPLVWGNFVVRAAGEPVRLKGVELIGASPGLRIRRAMVADGKRPQARVLVFEAGDFAELPTHAAWQDSLHPLAGYTVRPGEKDAEVVLELATPRRGSFQVTGGVRLRYGDGGAIVLPNQLSACAPAPCEPKRPAGF
jgi:hypothetical protein